MVSIRRRRLLGLHTGKSLFLAPVPKTFDGGQTPENATQNSMPFSMNPVPSIDVDQVKENGISKVHPGSSNMSTSSSSKEQQQQFSVPEVKSRKRHRRKHFENQEPCMMRGVYFKNMEWQAAIEVENKQIHLGTAGSQEEAARLYDRAAFMCGREPNFELSEEDKKELRKLNWEEFMSLTHSAIASKTLENLPELNRKIEEQTREIEEQDRKIEEQNRNLEKQNLELEERYLKLKKSPISVHNEGKCSKFSLEGLPLPRTVHMDPHKKQSRCEGMVPDNVRSELIKQMNLGLNCSNQKQLNDLIRRVRRAMEYCIDIIAKEQLSEQGKDMHVMQNEEVQACYELIPKDYGDLMFLKENKDNEKLYCNEKIIDYVAETIKKNKSRNILWREHDHYLKQKEELDTSVVLEFCDLLSVAFGKEIQIINSLLWKKNVDGVAQGLEFKHPVDAKNYKKVFIAVLENNHFFSIHIQVEELEIYILDSLNTTKEDHYQVHLRLLVDHMFRGQHFKKEKWTFYKIINNPKQDSKYDCGLYMLKNLEYWAKGEKLPFNKQHKLVARHVLLWEVIHKQLLKDDKEEMFDGVMRTSEANGLAPKIQERHGRQRARAI